MWRYPASCGGSRYVWITQVVVPYQSGPGGGADGCIVRRSCGYEGRRGRLPRRSEDRQHVAEAQWRGCSCLLSSVDGYATGLYVVSPSRDEKALANGPNPKVLYTEFLHDASLERVKGEYESIHTHYCKLYACDAQNEASFAALTAHLAAAKRGEAQLILVTDQGVSIQRNGAVVASINDPNFGKGLVQSLLSEAAPTDGFRQGLLGNTN